MIPTLLFVLPLAKSMLKLQSLKIFRRHSLSPLCSFVSFVVNSFQRKISLFIPILS